MPETVVKSATCETAYGETLAQSFDYMFEYVALKDGDEIPRDEQPTEKDIRNLVNQSRAAASRAKALNAEFDARSIVKPTMKDVKVQVATIVRALVASGRSKEEAESIARATLGVPA